MSEIEPLIRRYLAETHTMQLATLAGDQPWICSLYFVVDDHLNLYWISTPGRRHSREIAEHPAVAAAVAIQFAQTEPVVGIQVEGDAERITEPSQLQHAATAYHAKFQHDGTFVEDFVAGTRQHKFYRLKPRLFVLFDEQTYKSDARKEWRL